MPLDKTVMSNPSIHVRAATAADVGMLAEFSQRLAAETEGKTLDPTTVEAGVRAALEQPNACRYFVAEVDGVRAGQTMVTLEWSDWRNGWFWWITSVYVDERFRGRGVFRSLHAHIRELARRSKDVCGLRLYVEQQNRRAMETYTKLGMGPSGHTVYEEDWSLPEQ